MLTLEYLKQELIYKPESGLFYWRVRRKGRRMCDPAGTLQNFGYIVIMLDGVRYVAQQLVWLYVTGKWPECELDHIDQDRSNNRFENLREATRSQNATNQKIREDNSSGHTGVCWDKQKLKWKVQISVKGQKRLQKHFIDFETACSFYRSKATELFGEFVPDRNSESAGET